MKRITFSLLAFFLTVQCMIAQDAGFIFAPPASRITGAAVEPRQSPLASASVLYDKDDYVRVIYSQPHLRGRQMLGGDAIPYGKVWRLGANEATEIFLTDDIEIANMELKEGAYSMFAIPEEDKWTIIFNKNLGQWGAYSYDEKKDVLRVTVPTTKADKTYEAFTIWFDKHAEDKDKFTMNIAWGTTMVSVPMKED